MGKEIFPKHTWQCGFWGKQARGSFHDKHSVHTQLSENRGRQEVKLKTEEEGKCVWGGVHVCGECGVCILYTLRENLNAKHSLQEGSAGV